MMTDYQPNSHKSKANNTTEKKKLEKVVSGKVKTKKKNEFQKLAGNIISEEATNLKSYIILDVLIPAIKDAIEDVVINGIRMLLRGETGARRSGGSSGVAKVSYNKAYDSRDTMRGHTTRGRVGYSFDNVVLETKGEAEDVLTRMDELIDTYGIVSVADMYDLVGVVGNYTDNKYGWTNLRSAEIVRVRDGYLLKFPRVMPID